MKAMEAVRIAKNHLHEMLEDEGVINVGLEEIEFDEAAECWNVTIGFSRPWDKERTMATVLGRVSEDSIPLRRDYRILKVSDRDGSIGSIRIRAVAA